MRRFFLGLAIASLTASAPVTAFGGDREIADQIITNLKKHQSLGSLKGFDIDLSVEQGIVTLSGMVANSGQIATVLETAHGADGVKQVVSQIEVRSNKPSVKLAPEQSVAQKPSESMVKPASDENTGKPAPITLGGFDAQVAAEGMEMPEPPRMIETKTSAAAPVSSKDTTITDESLRRLGLAKSDGLLKNFDLDISTVDAEVWVRGHVANAAQKTLVLQTVQRVPGVVKVIDDLAVADAEGEQSLVKPASDDRAFAPMPPQSGSMPVLGHGAPEPRAFAPSQVTNYEVGMPMEGAPVAGGFSPMPTPMPMNMGQSYGAGVPRYDQPQMPNYAWPSYAAYPNYAAVTYPKQYSASAWPYIGPFYPYPQVPLGWRKVALEWDDGLWYLDFTSK